MENKQNYRDALAEFIANNVSNLSKIPETENVKISLFEFTKLHTLFMNTEMAILSAVDFLLEEPINRPEALERFRALLKTHQENLDDYFIEILKKNMEANNVTSE